MSTFYDGELTMRDEDFLHFLDENILGTEAQPESLMLDFVLPLGDPSEYF